jgi:hypothetical protein
VVENVRDHECPDGVVVLYQDGARGGKIIVVGGVKCIDGKPRASGRPGRVVEMRCGRLRVPMAINGVL